jgi:uncharacterized membrane protein YkvA (DUF1232 family)
MGYATVDSIDTLSNMLRLLAIRSVVLPFIKLVWRLLLDKRVPVFTKTIPLLAVAYIISPYDFIADWRPVLGQFDDLIVTVILFILFILASPRYVVLDQTFGRKLRKMQDEQGLGGQNPFNFGNPHNPNQDEPTGGKTVDAEFRYVDNEQIEDSDEEK